MSNRIYIEKEALQYQRAQDFLSRNPHSTIIECEDYREVFNPKGAQNFSIQKRDPAFILAVKHGKRVHSTPESFGIGSQQNYYFSHLLNCPFDCRYCFLQGMYSSANYVWFVNHEDFMKDIIDVSSQSENPYFFSGYDGDSLALESKTQFLHDFIPFFSKHQQITCELRSKSAQVSALLKYPATDNIICAFSLSPQCVIDQLEHRCASLKKRIEAMKKCVDHGWRVGFRFDPIIYFDGFETQYKDMIVQIMAEIPKERLHSVSVGALRFPKSYFKKIKSMYPNEPLFAQDMHLNKSTVGYQLDIEKKLEKAVLEPLAKQGIPTEIIFRCKT